MRISTEKDSNPNRPTSLLRYCSAQIGLRARRLASIGLALGVVLASTSFAAAADFSDPDWPCIQRKVPHLSVGQMWSGPPIDEAALTGWRKLPAVSRLAPALAIRRTSLEEAEALIADFADAQADGEGGQSKAERLTALFAGTFALINDKRSTIIAGIARYAHKQEDLAAKIEAKRDALSELKAAAEPDLDKIEELQDGLDWDTRIYRDRAQSLTYVCETPVILERRAFSLAHAIMAHLD